MRLQKLLFVLIAFFSSYAFAGGGTGGEPLVLCMFTVPGPWFRCLIS